MPLVGDSRSDRQVDRLGTERRPIAGGADRPKPLHFPEKAVALLFDEQAQLMNI
jgi:hypothetical protein